MHTKSTTVSVVIPVFNAGKYVAEAIDSVLAQDIPLEIVAIDDASTDNSLSVLDSYGDRITVLRRLENGGIGAARNDGLSVVHGDYIAFLDADDIWLPGKLKAQLAQFAANPTLGISFAHLECFVSPELSPDEAALRHCPQGPMPGYIAGTAVVRADIMRTVGLFDPRWRVGEFIDWLARAKAAGCALDILPEVFLRRRIHSTNTGIVDRAKRNQYARIVKDALDRKRRS